MRKLHAKLVGSGVTFLVIAAPMVARAQGLISCGPGTMRFCQFCDIFTTIHNVFTFFVLQVTVPLATLMFIVGGLILMFGGGSPSLLTRAKTILRFTLIGVLVVLLSWLIVNTTINVLTGGDKPEGFEWPWHSPNCVAGTTELQICLNGCPQRPGVTGQQLCITSCNRDFGP